MRTNAEQCTLTQNVQVPIDLAGTSRGKKLGLSRGGLMLTFTHVCSCGLGPAAHGVSEESGGGSCGEVENALVQASGAATEGCAASRRRCCRSLRRETGWQKK